MSDIAGRIRPTPPSLRYVVLRHDGIPDPHYDLMFETAPGSPLATWRADRWPIERESPVTKLADHRRAYLDYEGPVSGNRGAVHRVTAGYHKLDRHADDRWTFTFRDTMGYRQLTLRREGDRWYASP